MQQSGSDRVASTTYATNEPISFKDGIITIVTVAIVTVAGLVGACLLWGSSGLGLGVPIAAIDLLILQAGFGPFTT